MVDKSSLLSRYYHRFVCLQLPALVTDYLFTFVVGRPSSIGQRYLGSFYTARMQVGSCSSIIGYMCVYMVMITRVYKNGV